MSALRTLRSFLKKDDVKGKIVLVRVDLNVPMHHGKIVDDTRIRSVVPTIEALLKKKAKVVVLSHFGRPKDGFDASLSLAPIADALGEALGREVQFGVDCIGLAAKEAVGRAQPGEVVLLENLRFHPEEEKNDPVFSKQLAVLGDFYINDAFACSHRAHASIEGVAKLLPAYAGFLMEEEIGSLEKLLNDPARPLAAIVGGSKISSKLGLLESLLTKVDFLCVGGGMANTFLLAQGYEVGKSLVEKEKVKTAKQILKKAEENGCKLLLPRDVVVAPSLEDAKASCLVVEADKVPADQMILDVGPHTIYGWLAHLDTCKTIVWNGPLGAFEHSPYEVGSISLSRCIAGLTRAGKVKSVAGGGDILATLAKARLLDSFTYISTAGGAFLEWLEGVELPGVKVLRG